MASLAPDDERSESATYDVASVYDQGRELTVRCRYANKTGANSVVDVRLPKRVDVCRFTEGKTPVLNCE